MGENRGTGMGGGTSYSFTIGGYVGVIDARTIFVDDTNVPPWYDLASAGQSYLLVHEDVISDAYGGGAGQVTIDFRPPLLAYPAYFWDEAAVGSLYQYSDSTTFATDGTPFAYGSSGISVGAQSVGLIFTVAAGTYPPGTDVTLGNNFITQNWSADYDNSAGAAVAFSVAILKAPLPSSGGDIANALLSIMVQNNSGSTITDLGDGSGSFVVIKLPTNAVNPDSPTGTDEFDVSFAVATAGAPTLWAQSHAGTVTTSGDRHTLNFQFDTASIPDGERAQFVFPVYVNDGTLTGSPSNGYSHTPVPISSIGTTPSATVKTFTDDQVN